MVHGKTRSFFVHDKGTVQEVARNVVETQEEDNAFYVCDLRELKARAQVWRQELPGVVPYYAVKACSDPVVIDTLAMEGFNFDCSNKNEIQRVLKSGVDASRIVYANPAKQASHLDYAKNVGVTLMTFDCVEELEKISDRNARLLLRFAVDGKEQGIKTAQKFGCRLSEAEHVLKTAIKLGISVVGVAFQLGSVSCGPDGMRVAIQQSRQLFDMGARLGIQMTTLNIGGGFPGGLRKLDFFAKVCAAVRSALDTHFPESCGTNVIAEPGRFFAASSYALAVKVVAKRTRLTSIDGTLRKKHDVYVNESQLNCVPRALYALMDIKHAPLSPPYERRRNELTTLWGATCHPRDAFEDGVPYFDVSVGEWLLMDNVGAYGLVNACGFNGIGFPPVHYRTDPEDVGRVSRLLQASKLSPGYSQPDKVLKTAEEDSPRKS
ncbi:ornithine decarboxylase-like isoform X2 [Haemaphysalis longicornis]